MRCAVTAWQPHKDMGNCLRNTLERSKEFLANGSLGKQQVSLAIEMEDSETRNGHLRAAVMRSRGDSPDGIRLFWHHLIKGYNKNFLKTRTTASW